MSKRDLVKLTAPPRPKYRRKLVAWQLKYCLWYADAHAPSVREQTETASRLAGRAVTYHMVQTLRRRDDFQELLNAIHAGGLEAAKAILVNDLPMYMSLHAWAAQRAKEKDDVRAIASYTVPVLDRVAPKHDLVFVQPQVITISLNEKQRALLAAPSIEVTGEFVDYSPKPLPPAPTAKPPDLKTVTP